MLASLMVFGLVAVGVRLLQPSAAIVASKLKASPSNPVANEKVSFSGHLTTKLKRPVELQVKDGSKWKSVAKGTSDSAGTFALSGKVPDRAGTFRVYAPKAEKKKAQASKPLAITPRKPTAALVFLPPVAQSKTGETDLMPVNAVFGPSRTGRPVALERLEDGKWKSIDKGTTNKGKVSFSTLVSANDTRKYRAVAKAYNGAADAPSAEQKPAAPKPIFSEDFNGSSLDSSKWDYFELGYRGAAQRTCSESHKESVSVSGGYLKLLVKEFTGSARTKSDKECPYGEFKNGAISTSGKFAWKTGVMAVRMKFPHQRGQHGAAWSLPLVYNPTPGNPAVEGVEIDSAEYYGDGYKNGGLSHLIHWYDKGPSGEGVLTSEGGVKNSDHLLQSGRHWSDDYHVYSVEWKPSGYVFRVDGNETFRTGKGVSNVDQYLILSLQTSAWELPKFDIDKANAMSVDWIKVWKN